MGLSLPSGVGQRDPEPTAGLTCQPFSSCLSSQLSEIGLLLLWVAGPTLSSSHADKCAIPNSPHMLSKHYL